MIVLDTNVVSALMLPVPEPAVVRWLDRQIPSAIYSTSVTILEIRFGVALMVSGRRRDSLGAVAEKIFSEDLAGRVLAFDTAAAEQTAKLMALRRLEGRPGDLRDSMIAGIVLSRQAALATRNVRHFENAGLTVINPWTD